MSQADMEKVFKFTEPAGFTVEDVDGILVRLHFIIKYSKTPKFTETIETPGEFQKMADYILRLLKHFTTRAVVEITKQGEPDPETFSTTTVSDMMEMNISNLGFQALAVLIRDYHTLGDLLVTNSAFLDFMTPFWFDTKMFYFFPASLQSLENLTWTERTDTLLESHPQFFQMLVSNLCTVPFSTGFYSTYGSILSNISSFEMGPKLMMEPSNPLIVKILGFLNEKVAVDLRIQAGEAICCLCETRDYQVRLLGPEIDILPLLLLPLAGPEEFTDEENDSLPLDLQYLAHTKEHEPNVSVRRILLRCVIVLLRYKESRMILREKNAYLIMRELHKIELDEINLQIIEGIVEVLILTEEELLEANGVEDLVLG